MDVRGDDGFRGGYEQGFGEWRVCGRDIRAREAEGESVVCG